MRKSFKFKLGLLIFSTIIALVLAEIILRVLNPSPFLNKAYQRKDIAWMEKNVDLNSVGFRDKEYDYQKAPETFRILTLGDSYTFGWLVDNPDDTYPKFLEKELNEKNIKAEVINAGSPGYSLAEMINRFKSEGKNFYPDLVILGINDDEANVSKTYVQPEDTKLNPAIKSLHLYQVTFGNYYRNLAEEINHDYVLKIYTDQNSKEWESFSKQVLELKSEVNKINSSLVIILFPHIHPSSPNDQYDYYSYNERLKQFGKENGISIIDPLEEFLNYKNKQQLVIHPLDPHPTGQMNKLVAQSFINQFDINKFLQTHQEFIPQTKTVLINPDNLKLDDYHNVKKINSIPNEYPWVYFDTKFDKDIQTFPLKDKSFRNSKIYLDNLQTAKTFTHSALPGATILYHIYPKEDGKIFIPKNIYNYEVIGLNHVYALEVLEDGTIRGDYISPSSVTKNDKGLEIQFYKDNKYHIFRINLKVGVKQLDISPEGNIQNIASTYLVKTTQPEKSSLVTLPFTNKVSSWAEFAGDDTKAYTYGFVDGKMTKVKEVKIESDKIILTFYSSINKDQQVEFPVLAQYNLGVGENIEIEYE